MRNLLLFIASTAILLALASCSNDNKARGREIKPGLHGGYIALTGVRFLDVNPMTKVGDTLTIGDDLYVIDTIVVRK